MSDWEPPSRPGAALRCATRDDLDALWAVEQSAHEHPWTRDLLAAEFDTSQSRVWCACDEGGAVVGLLVFWVIGDLVDILDVAVHRAAQRRGIARTMVGALFEACAGQGVVEITLEVREHNVPARALYERSGFKAVGRRARYYSDTGEAAVLMSASVQAQSSHF